MDKNLRPEWMMGKHLKEVKEKKRHDCLLAEERKMARNANSRDFQRRLLTEAVEAKMEGDFEHEAQSICLDAPMEKDEPENNLFQCKEEAFKELKLRQRIWESSSELKELKVKLRSAYIAKEVAAQIAEKQFLIQQEKLEHQRFMDMMAERDRLMKEHEAQISQEALTRKLIYRDELQKQIIQAYKREEKYQEFLKEKALLDQIVRAIHEEDQREEEMRMQQANQTRREIEEFCRMQNTWRQMEKQALEEEDRRIKAYLEQNNKQEQKKIEELKQREDEKKLFEERIHSAFINQQIPIKEKEERQEVLRELQAEELREQDLQRVKEEFDSILRKREQLSMFYRQQLENKRRQLEEEEYQEKIYRQQILAKFAEDTRLEQLTAEKRRLKMLEHRRDVQRMLEEKRSQRAQEWEELRVQEELRQREEKQRAQIIEEERIHMLKKHATKLLGYLPRGVLREDDLTHLGSDFLEKFNRLNSNFVE